MFFVSQASLLSWSPCIYGSISLRSPTIESLRTIVRLLCFGACLATSEAQSLEEEIRSPAPQASFPAEAALNTAMRQVAVFVFGCLPGLVQGLVWGREVEFVRAESAEGFVEKLRRQEFGV